MQQLILILYRQRWPAIISFAIAVSAVAVIFVTIPKNHDAVMKVLVKHSRPDTLVGLASGNTVVRADVTEEDVNTEVEILKSAELMRDALLRTHTLTRAQGQTGPNANTGEALATAVQRSTRNLTVSPIHRTNIIQVTYRSNNAVSSVSVLKVLAELYLQMHLRVHRTPGTAEFFEKQASVYEQELGAAQAELDAFRSRTNVVLLGEQKDLMLRRMMDTEHAVDDAGVAIREATIRVAELESQTAGLQSRVETQRRVVPNQYSVERLHTMLAELQNRRTELLAKFNSDDRLVQEMDKQLSDTTAALERARAMTSVEQTTDVNPTRQTLESEAAQAALNLSGLLARKASLTGVLSGTRARLDWLNSVTGEHDTLTRRAKELEESVMLYGKKREEARISNSLDEQHIANVSILELPVVPPLQSQGKAWLFVVAAFLLGACSMGVACVADTMRPGIDTADELHMLTGIPVLASAALDVPRALATA
jgi:uncharacterized protein involved in exopolysaccharide biosynthesis